MSTPTNLEAFAIEFEKEVVISELVDVQKAFQIDVQVQGNSAMANVKSEATALGPNTHTETMGLTSTMAVQGGGYSSSIAESLSLGTKDASNDYVLHH